MNSLTRWEPFRDMMTLRHSMDRLFDDAFQSMDARNGGNGSSMFSLALDVSENENEYVVKASVPGIAEEDLEITLDNHVLTIGGEFKSEEESEDVRYHLRERRYGKFSRSITLPAAVNEESIEANFENGVLTVHVPKAEEAKPKRIAVRSNKTIEGKAS